jgi:hypothetical protein
VRGSYTKAAPTTFEDLVASEMRKGCNYEIAAQRVLQLHGANALRNRAINKRAERAEDAEDQLLKSAGDLWASDPNLDRTEALRESRLAFPRLHKASVEDELRTI